MLTSLIIAIGGIVGLMILWMIVQRLWGKVFAEYMQDEDAMSGRTKCSNCGCSTICEKNKQVILE